MKMNVIIGMCVVAVTGMPLVSFAGILDCDGCHAGDPGDIRPIDAPYRNFSSGGFVGNHRSHTPANATARNCVPCHGNRDYTSQHMDGRIQLVAPLNRYSGMRGAARYQTSRSTKQTAGGVFFNQTSLPVPGRCLTANCHFESTTPVWGSAPAGCSLCHGAPPTGVAPDYSGGAAGSHAKHGTYFAGPSGCAVCHSDHTKEASPFSHATSGGMRPLSVILRDPLANPSGSYSRNPIIGYLPSQAAGQLFGSCSALYCHSPGTKSSAFLPPVRAAVWGGTLGCDGCHLQSPVSGSHSAHSSSNYAVAVSCPSCHAATLSTVGVVSSPARHVNMKVDVSFAGMSGLVNGGRYNGFPSPVQKIPGSAYASCAEVYCHSSGQGNGGTWPPRYSQPTWNAPSSAACGTCHDHGLHNSGPLLQTGSHAVHLAYDFTAGDGQNLCGVCHYGNGFERPDQNCGQCHFRSDALVTRHVNGRIEVDFVAMFGGNYNGTTRPGDGYGTCSNSYCHGDGTALATAIAPINTTPVWGAVGQLGCTGCHGFPPAYSNGSPKSNSHAAHAGFGCQTCHAATTADGTTIASTVRHVNKSYDVSAGPGISFVYTFSTGGGSCATISCHFNNSARWGAVLTCGDCHVTPPGEP